MVKRQIKTSVSEDDGEINILNENGKRPAEEASKENKKRVRTKNLYRQPTAKELNRLQETENLFNSNLFRLQVDEVLQEVKLKEKTVKRFNEWFDSFKAHLLSIAEDDTEYDLSDKFLTKHLKVKLPLSDELHKTKAMFKFHKFKAIDVVGSYTTGNAINSNLIIDLQITVPAETFTKNDSINYRYHKKRAAYLAYIASHLQKSDLIEELKFSWINMCVTKPVLDLKPRGKLGNILLVRIDLSCEEEAYKLHRYSPGRNNLRESWLISSEKQENVSDIGPPTPYYNSSVLCDLTANINHNFIRDTLSNSENLKQAVVLLKIWIRQRNLCISGHIVSLLVCALVQMKRINNIMSSYQIVRNVWIYLKTSDWDTKGLSLCKAENTPPIDQFLEHFPVVFLDKTGYYNICWQMCKGTYNALRRESSLAVDMLDNPKLNSFILLFMTPIVNLAQFDHIVRFKNVQKLKSLVLQKCSKEDKLNYGLDELPLVVNTIYSLLTKGLTDRVDLILQLVEADFSWPVKTTPEKSKDSYQEKLSFGLVLNPANAIKIVDKGPQANLPEAEQFRLFWGDKSELRRFADGSHVEACVWSADTFAQRRSISTQIVDYLMHLKFDVQPSETFHISDQLDSVTARKAAAGEPGEEVGGRALQAFAALRRDLRGLTQLPLEVSAVYGTSPVFSYCDPLPALPSRPDPRAWRRAATCLIKPPQDDKKLFIPPYTPANRAVIELSHSGKWPGDLEAFRCLKAAFHLQISDRLTSQFALASQAYPGHIDVIRDGLAFRLQIAHPKEVALLRRGVRDGVVTSRDCPESVRVQRDTALLASVRGALHGLHQKHPSFGPAACLFKRWLSAHLLSPPHFPSTLAELVVASVFLQPEPLSPPAQPAVGLVRALRVVQLTDWTTQVVVLDFNGDMTREEITELEQKFSNRSEDGPHMCIVTSYDGDLPSVWSISAPSREVLSRVQTLAGATLRYMEKALLQDMEDNVLGAFVPSYAGYDVLLRLHATLVPHRDERVDARPKLTAAAGDVTDDVIPALEFNPVEMYLRELRSAYDEFALFFHDSYGGDVIAVLWRPHVGNYRDFQVSSANALKPVTTDGQTKYKVNVEAIIEDFKVIGEGLVKDVVINS